MGVISPIPDDLLAFYGDDYYRAEGKSSTHGYSDYSYTAEHGVRWAASLVKLLRPQGACVLDIGCADGHLLAKLGPNYTVFGIEANEAAGRLAAQRGVVVLGRDLLDPNIVKEHAGRFDVITAIAVFEHLRDIRAAMENALHLLRTNGVLLFEVPLMSPIHDNTVWFTSSLEHVWYPSEKGLRHLVTTELGAQLLGVELHITGYGSTYVGLVFRETADEQAIRGLAARVLLREVEPISAEEAAARMELHLVHGATTTIADVGALATLPSATLNPQLLRRLVELWQADLNQLGLVRAEIQQAAAREQKFEEHTAELREVRARLMADLEAAESDRIRSYLELTTSLVAAEARLAAVQSDLAARLNAEIALDRQRKALGRAGANLREAEQKFKERRAALEAGAEWRAAVILREIALRYPRAARLGRRIARVLWWTLHGRLISQLRLRQEIRAQLRNGAAVGNSVIVAPSGCDSSPSPPSVLLQNVGSSTEELPEATTTFRDPTIVNRTDHQPRLPAESKQQRVGSPPEELPGATTTFGQDLVILNETGHRPRLLSEPEEQSVWPLVSVIVTSFNYGRFVAAAVDSALNQTFKDLEVIVVEGGSPEPDSRIIVAGLRRPRTRVLMQGAAHPAGANRNFGISQARGRYICCLDADDTLAPTYIEKAVFLLERHGYDVVSCAMEKIGDDYGPIGILEQPDLSALLAGNHVLTSAVFRRSLWERSGGYRDVDRKVHGYAYEDWAFWIRLAALGGRFRNLHHDPLLRYRIHNRSLSRGGDVNSMERQRAMVRLMNQDLLRSACDRLAHSRELASIRYGTPCAPPAPIILDRAPPVPKPPTLLLAMPFLILGGAERLLSAVVAHLVQKGWRIVIITSIEPPFENGDTTSWFEPYTDEIFHLPRFLPSELWEDFLHHLVRSRGIEIVWVVGSAFAYDCLRELRVMNPDLRVADLLFNTIGHTANNRRRRDLIDLIFVENKEVHDWLLARGEDASCIRLVESGVDLTALRPVGRSDALVEKIGATADDLIVGFSGRWAAEKNPLGFVEIARLVDPALPVRFVITGTGPLDSAIKHALHEGGFPDGRFHLLGEVPEIRPVLASFDLLVVPSVLDGRPVVVQEALALGVPVLCSRVGALPELVQDGVTGWLCQPDDLGAFAARIEYAGRRRAELVKMRQRARAYAEAKLDIQRMLTRYLTELESLLPRDRHHG
jgi:glycosyltransferase involved in cell wall biosynthesis/SAM-dependent methyltransferase